MCNAVVTGIIAKRSPRMPLILSTLMSTVGSEICRRARLSKSILGYQLKIGSGQLDKGKYTHQVNRAKRHKEA